MKINEVQDEIKFLSIIEISCNKLIHLMDEFEDSGEFENIEIVGKNDITENFLIRLTDCFEQNAQFYTLIQVLLLLARDRRLEYEHALSLVTVEGVKPVR